MPDHLTIRVADLAQAREHYDFTRRYLALIEPTGAAHLRETPPEGNDFEVDGVRYAVTPHAILRMDAVMPIRPDWRTTSLVERDRVAGWLRGSAEALRATRPGALVAVDRIDIEKHAVGPTDGRLFADPLEQVAMDLHIAMISWTYTPCLFGCDRLYYAPMQQWIVGWTPGEDRQLPAVMIMPLRASTKG
jgi:hypothetical protein